MAGDRYGGGLTKVGLLFEGLRRREDARQKAAPVFSGESGQQCINAAISADSIREALLEDDRRRAEQPAPDHDGLGSADGSLFLGALGRGLTAPSPSRAPPKRSGGGSAPRTPVTREESPPCGVCVGPGMG